MASLIRKKKEKIFIEDLAQLIGEMLKQKIYKNPSYEIFYDLWNF